MNTQATTTTTYDEAIYPPTAPGSDESALVCGIRVGDPRAFEQMVRQYGPRMLAVTRRILKCEEDCADAVQDAFLSAFKHAREFEGSSSLGTWLHRIVVNACLMHLRRHRHEPSIEPLLPSFAADGHHASDVREWREDACAAASRSETRDRVRACIDKLPPSYRAVLILRDIEELDTDQTARLLKCSPGNVKTRLHRARQALKTVLEEASGALIELPQSLPVRGEETRE